MDIQKHIIGGNEVFFSQFKYDENCELREILTSKKLEKFLQNLDNDILVVLGGDGTLLDVVKYNYSRNKKILGINFGNKGFLLHTTTILEQENTFETREYKLLEMSIHNEIQAIALNDFDIKAGDGKMLDLKITLDSNMSLDFIGDGIILSTPLGSTGYNSSLGGSILPHNIPAYILAPKAPWKPKGLNPIIFSNSQTLKIQTQGRQSPLEFYADGKLVGKYREKNIELQIKKSDISVQLLIAESENNSWDNRIFQEQGFHKI